MPNYTFGGKAESSVRGTVQEAGTGCGCQGRPLLFQELDLCKHIPSSTPHVDAHHIITIHKALDSIRESRDTNMSTNNTSSERTPLLGNDGTAETNNGTPQSKPSTLHRIESWTARHIANIILGTLVVLFFALFLVTLITRHAGDDQTPFVPGPSGNKICTGAGCVLASATLLRSLSPRFVLPFLDLNWKKLCIYIQNRYKELDPCEDFRAYACEGFDAIHEMREDQTSVNSLQVMSEEGQLILKRILESPAPQSTSLFWTASSPDQEIFSKMQDGYNACLNETLLKSIGAKPLIDLLTKVGQLYPVKQPKSKKDTSLTDAVRFLISRGVRTPISIGVGADDKDPSSNVISLSPPYSFGLPSKQYYNRSDMVTSYKDAIGSVLEALIKEAHPKDGALSIFEMPEAPGVLNQKVVDDLVDFESQMASVSPDPEDLSDITKVYNPRTVDEAEAYNPAISVKSIIDHFTNGYKPSKIIVASPDYLRSLADILANETREVLRAYLVWKVVQSYGSVVEDDAVEPLRRFNNKLQGKEADAKSERWRTCINVVDSDLRKSS